MAYIKIIRPLNLLIIFVTQTIIYKIFIIDKLAQDAVLNLPLALLLSLVTCIIAAGGYIINDYFDFEIDLINKPEQTYVGVCMSRRQALNYYILLLLFGLFISFFIAWETQNMHLMPLYPVACIILFLYAWKLKLYGYVGNNIVAMMTAFVGLIIVVAERTNLLLPNNQNLLFLIIAFSIFAYFINLIREIVKDMEDLEGDALKKSRSLPGKIGVERSKMIIYFNLVVFVCLLLIFCLVFVKSLIFKVLGLAILLPLILYFAISMKAAKLKSDFTRLSFFLKVVMFIGIIYLYCLSFNQ